MTTNTTFPLVNNWGNAISSLYIWTLKQYHLLLPLICLADLCPWDSQAEEEHLLKYWKKNAPGRFPDHFLGFHLDWVRGEFTLVEFKDCKATRLSWQSCLFTIGPDAAILPAILEKAWQMTDERIKANGKERNLSNEEIDKSLIHNHDNWAKVADTIMEERYKLRFLQD